MQERVRKRNTVTEGSESFVPEQLLQTVQMKTVKARMKQATEQNLHDPSRCSQCTERRGELEQEAFIRRKTTQLQNRLLEEKIQLHLQNHSSAWLIAETLRDLPKPSDSHDAIWEKVLSKQRLTQR